MRIVYLHASKFGNGAAVAARFRELMADRGVTVEVHHIREVSATVLPVADLYVFSSPGRIGKPIGGMRRFLRRLKLPLGTPYALLTTEGMPRPDKRTGEMPTEEELARYQRVRPIMNEILGAKGLVKVGEEVVHVTGLRGPLEDGWEAKVRVFVTGLLAAQREPRVAEQPRLSSSPS